MERNRNTQRLLGYKLVNNDSARRAAVPVYFVPHVRVTAR